MKKYYYLFLMLGFFLFSCGGNTEQQTEDSDEAVTTEEVGDMTEAGDQAIKDCDDFLDKYDQWTDDYLKVVESWMKDPTNVALTQEYTKLAEELSTWGTDWTNYVECASREAYQKRFQEISDKVEQGLEKLGLGE
jgi:hypothetical protein